jgi:hypothetical protein
MWLLLLIVEIAVAGFLAVRLGMEAEDKGFSRALFIFLSCMLWFIMRILGRILGWLVIGGSFIPVACGWLFAIVSFMVFYYFIARIKDKEFLNQDNIEWKNRNADPNLTKPGNPEEK